MTGDIYEEDIYERDTHGLDSYFTIKRNSFVDLPHNKDDFYDKDSYKVKIITDNIVIGYPVLFDDAESELGRIFFSLAFFQLSMVNQGFFLRGAISIDNLYIDEHIVYGKGLIDSYLGESQKARDPRIILTETASLAVKQHIEYYAQPSFAPQTRDIFLDSDGQYFLNYLDSILVAVPEREPYLEEIQKHKQVIEQKLQEYRNQPLLWSKYAWTANYHNFFCDQHDYFIEEHKVDLSKYQMQPRLIF